MNLGPLTQMVRIEKPVTSKNPTDQTLTTVWTEIATVPASVKDQLLTNAEDVNARTPIGRLPSKIRIRYLPGVTAAARVVLLERDSLEMRIVAGPVVLGRNEGLEMMVEAYTKQGIGV
jgi:head-tail adaptor